MSSAADSARPSNGSGGAREGRVAGTAVGSPRCARIRRITRVSSMRAIRRSRARAAPISLSSDLTAIISPKSDIVAAMPNRPKSRSSDRATDPSPIRDTASLADVLKTARLDRKLSQAELARKLGLRQRQISDLERATTDPRLSTITNVARALELDLMLVPRHLISAVNALQRSGSEAGKRPLYALDDDEPAQSEVGDSRESSGEPQPSSRARRRQ